MKTLLILRHAKSSHEQPGLTDHQRRLNDRGLRDAPRVGEALRERRLQPDLVVSSTAERARETAELVAAACGYSPDRAIAFRDGLYLAPPASYVQELAATDDRLGTVLVVGHNPGISEWLSRLAGEFHSLPTAALAHLELTLDSWASLSLGSSGRLVDLWRPRGD